MELTTFAGTASQKHDNPVLRQNIFTEHEGVHEVRESETEVKQRTT